MASSTTVKPTFIDDGLYFPQLNSSEVLSEDWEADTVGLLDELFHCLSFVTESDVGPLLYIFSCLPVYTVVHQLEAVLIEVVDGCGSELLVELDIWTEPGRLIERNDTMNFGQPHAVLHIELEVE